MKHFPLFNKEQRLKFIVFDTKKDKCNISILCCYLLLNSR